MNFCCNVCESFFLSFYLGSFVVTSGTDQCPGQNAYMHTTSVCKSSEGFDGVSAGLHRGLQPVSVYVSDFTR